MFHQIDNGRERPSEIPVQDQSHDQASASSSESSEGSSIAHGARPSDEAMGGRRAIPQNEAKVPSK